MLAVLDCEGNPCFLSTKLLGLTDCSQSLNASLASNTLILNKIDDRTTSIYDMINQLVTMMPKVMGYSWEGGCSLDERPLRLLDALGRDLKIPALFLGSREVYHTAPPKYSFFELIFM